MDKKSLLPIMGISKLRINTDGTGIRTLIASEGCPLQCKYCINDQCHKLSNDKKNYVTIEQLYSQIKSHRIYFWASGGGVNFGGGEPLLYEEFILDFARKCEREINIGIETSLNVELRNLQELAERVQIFIVDIKDMNSEIYRAYTERDNSLVLKNLNILRKYASKVIIRVPHIPEFNTKEDIKESICTLSKMGFGHIDVFQYIKK